MNAIVKDWLYAIVEAFIIIAVMYFIIWPVSIDGISMESTFSTGDRVAVSKILSLLNKLDYGDIIVCKTDGIDGKRNIIKRIIALPGDVVEISGGSVYVNGVLLDEPYAYGMTLGGSKTLVPDNFFYVMGDNREFSIDSRDIGPVSKNSLIGKVVFRWFPFNNLKTY